MPHFFTRIFAAKLAFIFTFGSVQFSAGNYSLFETNKVYAYGGTSDVVIDPPAPTTTNGSAGGGEEIVVEDDREITTDSTLGKAQAELTAQEMRGYQSLYEMQAELFAECVAKLKNWNGALIEPADGWPTGAVTDLDKICAEELEEMNTQGKDRFLLPDASAEQSPNNQSENWWEDLLNYWFGKEVGLLPELKKEYDKNLRTLSPPNEVGVDRDLIEKLEEWYGKVNNTDGNEFLRYHLVTKNELQPVPFQQGIVTISSCPNPSSPIFANQQCVKTEWKNRLTYMTAQRDNLINTIGDKSSLSPETKKLIAWYAVDDTDVISNKDYGLTASTSRNPLQLDIQKLSFLVGLLEQLAKYSATVAYQLELKDSSGGMGIYGNFSTTNAGVDIAQITNLSGKENMTLSQTISKLSNTMVIIGLAIMIPIIVYAGFLMVLSGYDYEQYEKGNEMLWKVLPWAVFLCACRLLVAAWLHVLSEAFRPIASF